MVRETVIRSLDSRRIAWFGSILLLAALLLTAGPARSQEYTAQELEDLVAPVALYPDDVLGIILPASTFPLDIVRAVRFLDEIVDDPSLEPDPAWDDSIVALLNYPEVLRMLDENLDWTWELGEAVLTDQAAVLAAAQSFRNRAYAAGNLPSDSRQTVTRSAGAIQIRPADPEVVYIPVYEPREVVVFHPAPVWHYYPIGYPVYYYPYPAGYRFSLGYFWGVTSYFSIGWHSHYVHVHHHTHYSHPYYLNTYYGYAPYYPRNRVNVTVVVDNQTNVWVPSPRGANRPRTVSAEGRTSGTRTQRTATAESQPNAQARMRSQSATEPRVSTSGQRSTSTAERSTGQQRSTTGAAQRPTGAAPAERQTTTTETPRMQATRPNTATSERQRSSGTSSVRSPEATLSQPRSIRPAAPASPQPTTRQPSAVQPSTTQPSTRSQSGQQPQMRSQSTQSSTRSQSSQSSTRAQSGQSSSSSSPRVQGTTRSGSTASSSSSSSSSASRTRQR